MKCRLCDSPTIEIVDLGLSPPANNFITSKEDDFNEFPLIVDFCQNCYCIQLRDCLDHNELYKNYTYSTPESDSLTNQYRNILEIINRKFPKTSELFLFEIGSNNGELLKFMRDHFKKVLGIDPAINIAKIAEEKGIETICAFFNEAQSDEIIMNHGYPEIILARHMFAHNKDPKLLLKGIENMLAKDGILLIENAYAIDTFQENEFDQIYHEHMFYYSGIAIQNILEKYNLDLIDINFSDVHGGSSLFIAARKGMHPISSNLHNVLSHEKEVFKNLEIFQKFNSSIKKSKNKVTRYIYNEINAGKKIIAYGAPAKAFTIFAFYEFTDKEISYCIDTTPSKQGMIFPKSNIPIFGEDYLKKGNYDVVLVNAWNYKKEIISKARKLFKKGTKLLFLIPKFEEYEVF